MLYMDRSLIQHMLKVSTPDRCKETCTENAHHIHSVD